MKKLTTAVMLVLSFVFFTPAALALDLVTPAVLIGTFAMGVQASGGNIVPVPDHLTDACKPK